MLVISAAGAIEVLHFFRHSLTIVLLVREAHLLSRSPSGLTFHDGAIPSDEIWIKLGGDKGQGSFKFQMQLMNTAHPNSMKNTFILSVFNAGDSTTNLRTAIDMYKEHVSEAQGMPIGYEVLSSSYNFRVITIFYTEIAKFGYF